MHTHTHTHTHTPDELVICSMTYAHYILHNNSHTDLYETGDAEEVLTMYGDHCLC